MTISKAQGAEIIAAYRQWDGSTSAEEFARQYGITKTSLYGLLRREGVPTKTDRAFNGATDDQSGDVADWLIEKVAGEALRTILAENRQAHRLEDRIEALEAYCREHGLDPDEV